jgi:predicted transposase YdaD
MSQESMPEERSPRESQTYDGLIKSILRKHYPDLAAWLLGQKPLESKAVDTALATTAVRFADKLLHLKFVNRQPLILHVEFQIGGDKSMPVRMAQYLTLVLGTLQLEELKRSRIACFVIYLSREDYGEDPGQLILHGEAGFELQVKYQVVKLWEKPPEEVLAMEAPGLSPFTPLMAGNPMELVLKSQEKIVQAPESLISLESKKELLEVLAGLAGIVIKDANFHTKLFSEIRLMGKNYFFEVVRKEGEAIGLLKGRPEGRQEEARLGITRILSNRFGSLPEEFSLRLEQVDDLQKLEDLMVQAAVCQDLNTFIQSLG